MAAARRSAVDELLAWGAALGPVVAFISPLGMAPLAGMLGVLALLLHPRRKEMLAAVPRVLALILAAAHLWQLIATAWAPDPLQSLRTTAQLIALSVSGLALTAYMRGVAPEEAGRVLRFLAWSLAIALVVVVADLIVGPWVRNSLAIAFTGQQPPVGTFVPQRLNRTLVVDLLLAFPAAGALWRIGKRNAAVGLLALAALPVWLGVSLAAKLALAAALVGALAGWACRRRLAPAMAIAMAALVVVSPALTSLIPAPQAMWDAAPWLPNSAHHRTTIWRFASDRIAEHPWRGWGMDAARDLPHGDDKVVSTPPRLGWPLPEQLMPLHPHNAGLQWRLELGIPGAVLAVALLMWLGWAVGRATDRGQGALLLGLTCAAFIIAESSFGAWQAWWLGSVWLTAALCLAGGRVSPACGQAPAATPRTAA